MRHSRIAGSLPRIGATVLCALAGAASMAAAQTIAITGGTVYPVSGPKIERGTVLIRNGRIVAVGANVAVPADAQRIDATGKWVTAPCTSGQDISTTIRYFWLDRKATRAARSLGEPVNLGMILLLLVAFGSLSFPAM